MYVESGSCCIYWDMMGQRDQFVLRYNCSVRDFLQTTQLYTLWLKKANAIKDIVAYL
jgi:hypothetical protein